jgi:hypothetical protein
MFHATNQLLFFAGGLALLVFWLDAQTSSPSSHSTTSHNPEE